jgi:hypothetical protein
MQVLDLPIIPENIMEVLLLSFFMNSSNQYNPPFNGCTQGKAYKKLTPLVTIPARKYTLKRTMSRNAVALI